TARVAADWWPVWSRFAPARTTSSLTRAHRRRSASAGTIRTARHAGNSAPRTQSTKAATTTGAIRATLGLNEIRLPIAGMRGNANAASKLNSTPRTQPLTHINIPSITIDIMMRALLHPIRSEEHTSELQSPDHL